MLNHWLKPVALHELFSGDLESDDLGYHVLFHDQQTGLPDLAGVKIAIIGTDSTSADPIRKQLYKLSHHFGALKIVDLGNLRKTNLDFSIGALSEIRAIGILPIVIGQDIRFSQALYRALKMNYANINLVCVDESVPLEPANLEQTRAYLNPMALGADSKIFQLGLIGFQKHFTPARILQFVENQNYDIMRLGEAKAKLPEVEPLIRNADLMGVNLGVIRSADFIAVDHPSPSGFAAEETCKLAHYAGMSDKLKGFYLLGYQVDKDPNQQSAFVVAEMLWYFLEGYYHRKGDYPVSTEGLTEYIVELKRYDYQLTFWKSKLSGRWWIQVPVKVKKRDQRHRLIPCSFQDYKMATQDELPDRLIKAFKRFV